MTNLFESDGHKVICGDVLDVLESLVSDESVDLIFADPPYNIGKDFGYVKDKWPCLDDYVDWCKQWISLCINKLTPNGSIYIMTSTQAMPYIDIYTQSLIHVMSRIVWHYDSSGVQAKKKFGSLYEPILFGVKDKQNYTFNYDDIAIEAKTGAKRKLIDYRKAVPSEYSSIKNPGNVWYFARVRYRMHEYENHPTQKPESLLNRIILASSNPGDVVLDPFAGTYTTCAVASRLGRRSIGIDLNPDYVDIGLRRVLGYSSLNGRPLESVSKKTRRLNANGVKNFYAEEIVD
ncbi:MAG: adenine-specific DNA-methyltransferase [Bacteroidetes bacterium]|nr:adenine-specific DNA-methyltransferase [Bacteroidota bacterium]